MDIFSQAIALWLGGCLGSFANVLIYRLPKDESIVTPRSRCPKCKKMIAAYDNIPVLSWIVLRGRCRHCRVKISARYPVIEAVMAALGLALWRRWNAVDPVWAGLTIVAACMLLAITMIDWDTFLIPDELSLGLLALGLATAPLNPLFRGPNVALAYAWSLWGGLAGFALCYGIAAAGEKIFGQEAMGGGDIKLLAAVGAWSGAVGAFDCLMIGSLLGSFYGLGLMLRGKVKRSDPIPFGPFLSVGAVVNLFVILPLGFPFLRLSS
jgi:leader peptidase (prepilin peptidase) / N-methyltransferase